MLHGKKKYTIATILFVVFSLLITPAFQLRSNRASAQTNPGYSRGDGGIYSNALNREQKRNQIQETRILKETPSDEVDNDVIRGGIFDMKGYDSLRTAFINEVIDRTTDYGNLFDNAFIQTAKLTASDGRVNDYFGTSVAISGDTAVIGAPQVDGSGSNLDQGAVYVFVNRGLNWTFQQKLTASDGASSDYFGMSVAIEGNTIAVSARLDDVGSTSNQGSVYIFTRMDNTWSEQQKIVAADGAVNDYFGTAIAMTESTIIISATRSSVVPNDHQGAAYIFIRDGSNSWIQQAKLNASDGAVLAEFGISVAIDADYAIVGAYQAENGTGFRHGAAYIFFRSGSSWSQQQKLTAVGAYELGSENFGISVGIYRDTVIVGAWNQEIDEQSQQGAAHVFSRSGSTWTRQAILKSSDGTRYDHFGRTVSIYGETILVGSPDSDIGANTSQGAVYVFKRQNGSWTQTEKLIAADGAFNTYFGQELTLKDGIALLPWSTWNSSRGSVYVFNDTSNAPDLHVSSDTGPSNADNITNQRNLTFEIPNATTTVGATVELTRDGLIVASAVASGTNMSLTDNNAPSNGNFSYRYQQRQNGSLISVSNPTFVTIDTVAPTSTLNQDSLQTDPTRFIPINYNAVFSEPVFGFSPVDISLNNSTADVSMATITITGSGTNYNVAVRNVTSNGQTVAAVVQPSTVTDEAGNLSLASTSNDNSVTLDNIGPAVTINQALTQSDPTLVQPVNFTVQFSEPVTLFNSADIVLTGSTANVSSANITVTGGGTTYNVAVGNVTSRGQVTASVAANAARDAIGNLSSSSTSTDNTVSLKGTQFDFEGDGKTDLSIYRQLVGQWWYQQSSDNTTKALAFGTSSDKIVPSDYDGDGKTDVAFYRPSTGEWFVLRSSNLTFYAAPFGTSSDIPAPADFDGDGKADLAVFRPSSATWFINKSSGGVSIVPFGVSTDVPVVSDYDGDGKADIAIFRPLGGSGNAEWWILRSSNNSVFATPFGQSTDKPVQADYTGDGKSDAAFFRPTTGEWFVLRSEDLSFYAAPFGANGDVPVAGDYDGDGKADFAVFRSSSSTWFVSKSTGGVLIQGFGSTGDIPVPSAFVP